MMKLLAAVLVISASTAAGITFSGQLKRRVKTLQALLTLCSCIESELRCTLAAPEQIVEALCRNPALQQLSLLPHCRRFCREGLLFRTAWKKALEKSGREMNLQEEELETLAQLGEILGGSELENQCMLLENLRLHLAEILRSAEEDHRIKGRMYRTFGVLGGAAVVLLFI